VLRDEAFPHFVGIIEKGVVMIVVLFVLIFLLIQGEITAKAAAEADAKAVQKAAAKAAVAKRFRHARLGRMGRRIK